MNFVYFICTGVLVFFCLYAVKNGAVALIKVIDDIQAK